MPWLILVGLLEFVRLEITTPVAVLDAKLECAVRHVEFQRLDGQTICGDIADTRLGECLCQPLMVKSGGSNTLDGVYGNKLPGSASQVIAVPESRIVSKPVGCYRGLVDTAR
jgi:hypothetical protein